MYFLVSIDQISYFSEMTVNFHAQRNGFGFHENRNEKKRKKGVRSHINFNIDYILPPLLPFALYLLCLN